VRFGSDGFRTSPSLDRLIPEFGYIPGNVAWICMRCNTIKSDASALEIRRVADWIDRQMDSADLEELARYRLLVPVKAGV
jgi:hypothetical protein